jgi:hypothetical protein
VKTWQFPFDIELGLEEMIDDFICRIPKSHNLARCRLGSPAAGLNPSDDHSSGDLPHIRPIPNPNADIDSPGSVHGYSDLILERHPVFARVLYRIYHPLCCGGFFLRVCEESSRA